MSAFDKQVGGSHYKKYAIQPNEFAARNKLTPMQANVIKYVLRHADKNGEEDLDKAIHVIEMMREMEYRARKQHEVITEDNFFMILGAGRCGTTSLHSILESHPQIAMTRPKESTFWGCEYPLGLDFYTNKYFTNGLSDMNGDGQTRNLLIRYVPQRVVDMLGEKVKFIVMIRDPAARAISDWAIFRKMRAGREPLGMMEAMAKNIREFDVDVFDNEEAVCSNCDAKGGQYRRVYVETGMYEEHLAEWFRHFENGQFMIIDDFKDRTNASISLALTHLGVNCTDLNMLHLNEASSAHVKTAEYQETYHMLKEFYTESVAELSASLDVDYLTKWGY